MSFSFTNLQASVVKRLERFPEFAGLAILTERAKDFRGDVDRALGGLQPDKKPGLFLLVGTPTTSVARQQVVGPNLDVIVAVTCSENVLQNIGDNGSQIPAADAAINVLRALVGFHPSNCMAPLMPETPAMRVIADPFDDERLCYLATLKTQVLFAPLRLSGEGAFVKE
jgi:hypothetical protein